MSDEPKSGNVNAMHGKRMIEVKIRFWTNNIADVEGQIVPKRAWTSGVARMTPNDLHGIMKGQKPIAFNSLMQIPAAIEKVLRQNEIVLHPGKMKYIKPKGQ